jgi:predicted metal-binding protein
LGIDANQRCFENMHHSTEKIYYIEPDRKLSDLIHELAETGEKYNIKGVIPLKVDDISVAPWVRLKCKYGCSRYGKNWCCPPETPTPEKMRLVLKDYRKALLLVSVLKNGDFYKNNQRKRRIQVNTWKGTLALERRLFLAGYYKAFGLVSENCALCKTCTYPQECKFPRDRRPSVESCAIDIFRTLGNINKQFRIVQDVTSEYNCYSIILLE